MITAFDFVADMIWIRDLDKGKILEVNAAAMRGLGYRREELIGRPIYDFYFDRSDRSLGEEWSRRVRRQGTGYLLLSLRTRAGQVLEAELGGSLLEYEGQQALLVVARNIGEQIKERRRALTLYQGFKQSNDVMFYCDRNGVILDVNDAFTTHYGYAREEAIGKTPKLLQSSQSTKELYQRMWAGILDPKKGYWRGAIINRTKDGREIPLILTITAVRDAAGQIVGYISSALDMTEQVALQARVAQSETLAGIGEMAAVVAHEIRNPLGSIVMAARQIGSGRLTFEESNMVRQVLQNESQRLNEALNNFLSYARPRELKLERGDLNGVVAEVASIIQSNADLIKAIRMKKSLAKTVKPFPFDSDQIRQVVWNIVLNAIQAMDGQGTLTIATGRDGAFAYFKVQDTGPGIPESALPLIFKPFQTTKQQGTGLGLAIADRIVKSHGGRIEVASPPRSGASFTVFLPWIEED